MEVVSIILIFVSRKKQNGGGSFIYYSFCKVTARVKPILNNGEK